MTGEKMNKIYAQICLNEKPILKTEQERAFYNRLKAEMQKEKKTAEWAIPSE